MTDYDPPAYASRVHFLRRVRAVTSKLRWDFGEPDTMGWTFEDGLYSALYRDRYYGGRA